MLEVSGKNTSLEQEKHRHWRLAKLFLEYIVVPFTC